MQAKRKNDFKKIKEKIKKKTQDRIGNTSIKVSERRKS